MRGFVEVKESSFEDTIEHLHKIKLIACKAIKKMEEYLDEIEDNEDDETASHREHRGRDRYNY